MAAPAIIPILKKIAVAIVSDKKGRKVVIGIVLGVIFVIMMPIIAILGIFSGGIDLGLTISTASYSSNRRWANQRSPL